jgi:hypothetical protein
MRSLFALVLFFRLEFAAVNDFEFRCIAHSSSFPICLNDSFRNLILAIENSAVQPISGQSL